MTTNPRWAEILAILEPMAAEAYEEWGTGVGIAFLDDGLARDHHLGAREIEGDDGPVFLVAIPARVNELGDAFGGDYWQALLKAPPKVVVSKTGMHRIRNVRHQVMLVDLAAWRAWAMQHRDPSGITTVELRELAERWDRILDRRQEVAEDLKTLKAQVKARGFSPKVLGDVVEIRRKEGSRDGWDDLAAMMDLYLERVLGEVRDEPYLSPEE